MKKASDFLQVLSEYFDVYLLVTKGLSINTIHSYQYAFQILFEYLYYQKNLSPEKVSFHDLEGETIEQFLTWLETERNCSASTRNQRLAAISSFAKYAINKHFSSALHLVLQYQTYLRRKTLRNCSHILHLKKFLFFSGYQIQQQTLKSETEYC